MIDQNLLEHSLKTILDWDALMDKTLANKSYREAIPQRTRDTLQHYYQEGVPTGDFIQAVLRNDLGESFGRADSENREALWWIVCLIYNDFPVSARNYRDWIKAHSERRQQASREE